MSLTWSPTHLPLYWWKTKAICQANANEQASKLTTSMKDNEWWYHWWHHCWKEGFGKPYILVAGNQRIELKLKAWKRSRMKLNWNVPCRGLGFDGNGTIESVYSQSSQYYVISAVGLNNYQYAREPWCYLQAYPLVSKFRITCKSKKVKFRGKFILNFKKKSFQI